MAGKRKVKSYILDTSVVVKWFSYDSEDDQNISLRLRHGILNGDYAIIVPALMFYELANALRYNPRFDAQDVKNALKSVMEMGFDIRGIDADTMVQAVEIAFKSHVTVYDTYFLALSQTENMPLITADYTFVKHIKGFKTIIKLSDFAP
jgi:predicted nucleic acid-binding protein